MLLSSGSLSSKELKAHRRKSGNPYLHEFTAAFSRFCGASDYTNTGVLESSALLPSSDNSKYHLSHVGVVTFVNTLQNVQRFMKGALALVCNVRLNGLVRWKDYNVFAPVFQTTVGALCFVKRLAKFFMTMFHLVFSFVPTMTQWPVSGFSALTGNGGRCTARTVSEETKKNSPIIIARNVSFMTTGGGLMFSLSHPPSTEALERSSRKKPTGD